MQIGDIVYATGKSGYTFAYIVIDNVDGLWASEDIKVDIEEGTLRSNNSENGNFQRLTGELKPFDLGSCRFESIAMSWCRNDEIVETFLAIPVSDYEIYVKEGLIEPVK